MKRFVIWLLALSSLFGGVPAFADDYRYWPDFGSFAEHNSWSVKAINTAQAHKLGATGTGIKIAILDDGLVDYGHGLRSKVVAYKDFVSGQFVRGEHGTMVASTIAADENPEVGIAGVAPDASLIVGRVCHRNGCEWEAIRKGLTWAVAQGADVVSMSFTGSNDSWMHASMVSAVQNGAVVVGSMGNFGCEPYMYFGLASGCVQGKVSEYTQAMYPIAGLIAAGASNQRNGRVSNTGWASSFGPNMDLLAPGINTSAYDSVAASNGFGGTSASAPLIAAVAALVLSVKPDLTPAQVQAILQATAQPVYPGKAKVWDSCSKNTETNTWSCNNIVDSELPDHYYNGAGVVDAAAAVQLTLDLKSNRLSPAPTLSQSGLTLTVSWSGGPADLYLNSKLVAKGVPSGYTYQGFQNQSVSAQIVRAGVKSMPAIAMLADTYVPAKQNLLGGYFSSNASEFSFRINDLESQGEAVWRKTSRWDPLDVSYAGVIEQTSGVYLPCSGLLNKYDGGKTANFTCDVPEDQSGFEGTFRLIGKYSALGEPSELIVATKGSTVPKINLKVTYKENGQPTFKWDEVPGAQSYSIIYNRTSWEYSCFTSNTIDAENLVLEPSVITIYAKANEDCSGNTLASIESVGYTPLPPKPAKPVGVSVVLSNYQMVEFEIANRDPQGNYRLYRSDGYMTRFFPGQKLIVGIQENEDVNGKTFSYRFVQIKSDIWSESWSQLSDPVTVSFQSVEATTSSCVQQSVISCGTVFVQGAPTNLVEYLDSDFQVVDQQFVTREGNTRIRVQKDLAGVVYVRTSAVVANPELNDLDHWYRRGPGTISHISQTNEVRFVAQVR